jgi:hypothetical protein
LQAADPFYERLLREGTAAYNRADYATAIEDLKTAAFGFLEEPELLSQALCLLGVSQAHAQDEEGFRATFLRVLEVEERFGAYSAADINPDIRSEFEQVVVQLIPATTLTSNETFARLADVQTEMRLGRLPDKQRREELRRLVEEQPRAIRWALMLAQEQLGRKHYRDAIVYASHALEVEPDNLEARMIRGLAHAEEENWLEALPDLVASEKADGNLAVTEALLRCYVEAELWEEAAAFADSLEPEMRESRRLSKLIRKVDKWQDDQPEEDPEG